MDGLKLLGDLLNGAIASKTGQRVVRQAHPHQHPLRTGHFGKGRVKHGCRQAQPQAKASTTLGGLIGAAVRQHAYRSGATRRMGVGNSRQMHYGHQARRRGLNAGRCNDAFGGLSRREANYSAELLIRAMISAAKADERIDQREEAQITRELGGRLSPGEQQFVQREIARPFDPCALAADTPRGLEDEVYVVSLIAIDLDTNAEARYLHTLASELGLSHGHCNQLHQRYGERCLF